MSSITCSSERVGNQTGIDVLFFDSQLPETIKSTNECVGFISWFSSYNYISNQVKWQIKSDHKLEFKSFDNYKDEWTFYVEQESSDLSLYKQKYNNLFLNMAIKELLNYPEFVKWYELHPKLFG